MDRVQMYWHLYEKGMALIKLQRGKKQPSWGQKIKDVTERVSWENLKFGKGDNAGILTGRISGIIVLDIDYAERFPKDYEIPETFTVQTRKGYHHYYKLPADGKDYRNRRKGSVGFDIQANGGYIVAPGSSVDSWNYRVVCDVEPAPAPEWLLEVALESANPSPTIRVVIPVVQPAPLPEELRQTYNGLLSPRCPKGKRSELIWYILNQLVTDGLSNEEIISLFEAYPEGAGEKYFEKGGGRIGWLISQIEKWREELAERTVTPFEASNQAWVGMLYDDILKTFAEDYGLDVSEGHRLAFRQVCNLLIGLLDNEHSGWYCIPLGVGSGKTETIKHLIKFLYEHDVDRSYSIALSLEKISEIEAVKDWLIEKGIATDYFQIVHHKVEGDIAEVFSRLPRTPVVIHTHFKLKGTSYLSEYFLYKGNQRNLLIFDESMLSSMTSAERSADITSLLNRCIRAYELGSSLSEKIPQSIYLYFKEIKEENDRLEKVLTDPFNEQTRVDLRLPVHYLAEYDHPQLVKFSNTIVNELMSITRTGEDDLPLFRDLLLLGKADEECRQVFLLKEEGKALLFTMRELLSDGIKNLVTTDASRETRSVFSFSAKPVKIYDVQNFKNYGKLTINAIEFQSGLTQIKKSFTYASTPNPYLLALAEIVRKEKNKHRDFLIFHSKQLVEFGSKAKLHLIESGVVESGDLSKLHFETFGRENATNQYRHCGCVIFMGLHHKPPHAIKALLLGEMKEMKKIAPWMIDQVDMGELTMQIQQGSGRGTIRDGGEQVVYFFHHQPSGIVSELGKAFPGATINPIPLPSLEEWKQGYGQVQREERKKKDRVKEFLRYCKDKGVQFSASLKKEFEAQPLPPKKFLLTQGLLN